MAAAAAFAAVVFLFISGVVCTMTEDEDGLTLYVCEGQNLTLPEDVTPDAGENITDTKWYFEGKPHEAIAVYKHSTNKFLPSESYSQRAEYVPGAGIVLSHVTLQDAGNYTIEVTVNEAGGANVTYRNTAAVHVATVSTARIDATLEVRQEPEPVYDNRTGDFHVHLTCTSQGRRPPAVIWTTPSKENVPSSKTEGDTFSLLLDNPVTRGKYTCRLPPDSPAAKCLPRRDPMLKGASLRVKTRSSRLTLLEAGQATLMQQTDKLTAEYEALKSEIEVIKAENEAIRAENSAMRSNISSLRDQKPKPVIFHVRLGGSATQLSSGDHIVLSAVYTNQGGAYNPSTGEFTVPVTGYYFFTATAGSHHYSISTDYNASLYLMVDTRVVSYIYTKSVDWFEQGTCSYAGHLTQGQRVWLRARDSGTFGIYYTSFSGFLVSED